MKDRIIPESPAKLLLKGWKKPQAVKRQVPSVSQFGAIVADIRSQISSPYAQQTADFVEFLGLAGLGQAEASSLTWGDVDWQRNQMNIRRHKTDTHFHVPIYDRLRPLLERLQELRAVRASSLLDEVCHDGVGEVTFESIPAFDLSAPALEFQLYERAQATEEVIADGLFATHEKPLGVADLFERTVEALDAPVLPVRLLEGGPSNFHALFFRGSQAA